MKKRRLAALLTAVLCLSLLAGCGNEKPPSGGTASTTEPVAASTTAPVAASTKLGKPPQPDQILSDMNSSKEVELPDGVSFTTCEVIKRQSNAESKEDIVYCALTAESSFYRNERQYKLRYNFYDEGGWILDEVTPENEDEWTEAYLDAAGNDILEDMLWLDAFTPERLRYAEYIGEVKGVHYLLVPQDPNQTADHVLFTHTGSWVLEQNFDNDRISDVFMGEDGRLRFILTSIFGEGSQLLDADGSIISASYQWILAKDDATGLCVVKENGLYGAIDETGKLVVPIQHETMGEVIPRNVTTPPKGYQEIRWPDELDASFFVMGNPANGVFNVNQTAIENGEREEVADVVNAKGERVLSVPYAEASMDYSTRLITVFPARFQGFGSSYRLYDLNGNCRSPEFAHVGTTFYSHEIVNYQGRCGILPQILTDEERTYFYYQWGMEQNKE